MSENLISIFLASEEPFIQFHFDLFESNIINISILLGLLVYANKISFSKTLEERQKDIITTIENAQQDVVNASNYYVVAEKGFSQSLFWLQTWKSMYEKQKTDIVNLKYKAVKSNLLEVFSATETLITTFEKRTFLSLQRYILLTTASKILRKFLFLSENEKSKLIELTISKLGELEK